MLTPAPEPVGTQALPVYTAGRQEQPPMQLQHAPQWVSMAERRTPKIRKPADMLLLHCSLDTATVLQQKAAHTDILLSLRVFTMETSSQGLHTWSYVT